MKFNPRVILCFLFGCMITLVGVSFLTSCSSEPQNTRIVTNEDGTKSEVTEQRSSGGGMMGAVAAGAAAGTAGAVAHRATDHLINKHQQRKARRQTRPRVYNARRR